MTNWSGGDDLAHTSGSAARATAAGQKKRPQLHAVAAGEGKRRRAVPGIAALSERERLVLIELARGLQTEEIAEVLHLSPHTVRTHVKNSMRKLRARTRAQAVAHACLGGLVKSAR